MTHIAPSVEEGPLTRGSVIIDAGACKGCELCIPACPPGVLKMTVSSRNGQGYLYPELLQGCIACGLCAKVCPDFVFQVWRFDEAVTSTELIPSADVL